MANRVVMSIAGGGVALAIAAGSLVSLNSAGALSFGTSASAAPSVLSQLHQVEKGTGTEQESFLQQLADNLGISVDQLKSALKTTSLQELDKLVANGTITQQQADQIRTRIENGQMPGIGFGHFGHFGRHGHPFARLAIGQDLATFLKTDLQTLRQDLRNGQSLAQIASNAGISRDDLKAHITNEAQTALQKRVDSGAITQAQADARLNDLKNNLDKIIDRTHQEGAHKSQGSSFSGGPGGMMPGA